MMACLISRTKRVAHMDKQRHLAQTNLGGDVRG